jgi:hypothetical protein
MTYTVLDPARMRSRGLDVLVDHIGWVNTVRVMQEFETSRLDYTYERDEILPPWSAEELVQRMREEGGELPAAG